MTDPRYPGTGARHPICANFDNDPAIWAIGENLQALQFATTGAVEITQVRDGHAPGEFSSVRIPRHLLVVLARGLMAAHVNAGRLDIVARVDTPTREG